jgi:undecaprenyl-diphosphatase
MNEQLLDAINGHAGGIPILDQASTFAATYGIAVLAGLIAAFGLAELRRDRRRGLSLLGTGVVALGLALVLVQVAGHLVTEARPFTTDRDTHLLISHAADNSFPSDHATVAAAAAVVAALAWRRWAAVFLVLAFAIGLGRIYAGVHFPGDVLAGFVIGASSALIAWVACEQQLRPRLLERNQRAPS